MVNFLELLLLLIGLQFHQYVYTYPSINGEHLQRYNYLENYKKLLSQSYQLEDTINEIQKILEQDPSLPRLTRGEVEELYEKVTRSEYLKSIESGDMSRANSMRALMLVLPYNTDNNTQTNLQELYTRPPVTKVIDIHLDPHPIKHIPRNQSYALKGDPLNVGLLEATTFKPPFPKNIFGDVQDPTTYHPKSSKPMITKAPQIFEYITNHEKIQNRKIVNTFSSHYNAKKSDFRSILKPEPPKVKLPDKVMINGLQIPEGGDKSKYDINFKIMEHYSAESAPQPVFSNYMPQKDNLFIQTLTPKIKSDAYFHFKPLNIGEEIRVKPEIEGYLTRFGIVSGRTKKDFNKNDHFSKQNKDEQRSEESEISSIKVPSVADSYSQTNSEIELKKLLNNLEEIERLNTKFTSEATPISQNTKNQPIIIEETNRRSDPNLKRNTGIVGVQTMTKNNDELNKLLENLQELQKLKINPENALQVVVPIRDINTEKIDKKIKHMVESSSKGESILHQLQPIVHKDDKNFELSNATKHHQPSNIQKIQKKGTVQSNQALDKQIVSRSYFGPRDFIQLQKLLTDDKELERLYHSARQKHLNADNKNNTEASVTRTTDPVRNSSVHFNIENKHKETSAEEKQLQDLSKRIQLIEKIQKLEEPSSNMEIRRETDRVTSSMVSRFNSKQVQNSNKNKVTNDFDQLHKTDPNDFVQLHKLLSKIQELDRIRVNPHTSVEKTINDNLHLHNSENISTFALHLPQATENKVVSKQKLNSKDNTFILKTTGKDNIKQDDFSLFKNSSLNMEDYSLSNLEENTENLYLPIDFSNADLPQHKSLPTPMIHKMFEKNPEGSQGEINIKDKSSYLKELQKLLSNGERLEKFGIILPAELLQQVEYQLSKIKSLNSSFVEKDVNTSSLYHTEAIRGNKNLSKNEVFQFELNESTNLETTEESLYEGDEEKTVILSLTTVRPQEALPTIDSNSKLPVRSAAKIIEDAIKRVAAKYGVNNDHDILVHKRQAVYTKDFDLDPEYSEIHKEVALPVTSFEINNDKNIFPESLSSEYNLKKLYEIQKDLTNFNQLNNFTEAPVESQFKNLIDERLSITKNITQRVTPEVNSGVNTSSFEVSKTTPTQLKIDVSLSTDPINAVINNNESMPSKESQNGSLRDLEDSFGPDPNTENPLPAKKKNGFYFLADWNSFLEVGDGDDQVVIRLSPKIGDPRLFLPVKVP